MDVGNDASAYRDNEELIIPSDEYYLERANHFPPEQMLNLVRANISYAEVRLNDRILIINCDVMQFFFFFIFWPPPDDFNLLPENWPIFLPNFFVAIQCSHFFF